MSSNVGKTPSMTIQESININMVDLQTQYTKIKAEVDARIQEVLTSGKYINGPAVKDFSEQLANFLAVKHLAPCASGTDALQIALMALGLQPGDEVITVAFTFVATAEVISLLGLKPVFVDVNPHTFNMDVEKLEQAITPKTKCIIPVHLYGQSADMERVMQIANQHQITVIEDNAQAIGADFTFSNGTQHKVGTIGHIGCTSFYPSKNLGCYGDGGALFTNDDVLAQKIKTICNHGQSSRYNYDMVGVNSRLDSIQAAILGVKLSYLNEYIQARQTAADFYDTAFEKVAGIETPHRASYSSHVFHQYTLKVKQGRNELQAALKEKGIPSMIYYPKALHVQNAYNYCGYKMGDLPVTEQLCDQVISLPMHTELSTEQLQYITNHVIACVKQSA